LAASELKMKNDDLIVSKTDAKGKIVYCNDQFINFSGYRERELLGQPHNCIRHPEMPRSIFRKMWQTLQEGQEFFGFIKNQSKQGAFYWTFANVTPSFDKDNNLIGYFSVRRYPAPEAVKQFDALYQSMIKVEQKSSSSAESMNASEHLLNEMVKSHGGYNECICSFYK